VPDDASIAVRTSFLHRRVIAIFSVAYHGKRQNGEPNWEVPTMFAATNPLSVTSASSLCRCPLCSIVLPFRPHPPPYGADCQECGYPLWCCSRTVDDPNVLEVVSGTTPTYEDIQRLCDALLASGSVPNVVVDLSDVEFVSSSFIASLVALYKRMKVADGRLILCGLQHAACAALHVSRLDRLFEISDDQEAALATL
jgi:anti-anti-sigma factor